MSDFNVRRHVRARKRHRCYECGKIVAAGDNTVVASGIYAGLPYREYIHADCDGVSRAFAEEFDNWGEDAVPLHEIFDIEELIWVIGEHSAVAERLNAEAKIAGVPLDLIREEPDCFTPIMTTILSLLMCDGCVIRAT